MDLPDWIEQLATGLASLEYTHSIGNTLALGVRGQGRGLSTSGCRRGSPDGVYLGESGLRMNGGRIEPIPEMRDIVGTNAAVWSRLRRN